MSQNNFMAPTTMLPAELVMTILEHVYFTVPDVKGISQPDYHTLSACSLVCRRWSSLSQSLAFRDLPSCGSIRTKSGGHLYAAIDPSTGRGKMLGQYVRALDLELGAGDECNFTEELADWLARCPRLYQLTLHLHGLHELGPTVIHDLRRISTGAVHIQSRLNIRALRLLSIGVQSLIPYQLLSLWPSIQFLVLGTEIVATPPSELTFNFHLHELVLQRTLPINIVEKLLSMSENSLRILDFRDPLSPEIVHLLARHGPHIRSLRLMRYNHTSASLLRLCTNLEELIILHVPSFVPMSSLPSSLEHLAFLNAKHNTLQPVISAVNTLPNLRIVSCDEMSQGNSKFRALQAACDAKGVTLRLGPGRYWNEDLVVARRFPRGRSVSNFHLMN